MSFIQENASLLNVIKQVRLQSKCRLSIIAFATGFVWYLFLLNDIFWRIFTKYFVLLSAYSAVVKWPQKLYSIFSTNFYHIFFLAVPMQTLSSFRNSFLYQMFGCPKAYVKPLTRRQPHIPYINHWAILFDLKIPGNLLTRLGLKAQPSASQVVSLHYFPHKITSFFYYVIIQLSFHQLMFQYSSKPRSYLISHTSCKQNCELLIYQI